VGFLGESRPPHGGVGRGEDEIERGENMAAGRPKKEIDKEDFEKLCSFQCTLEEICSWFDVTTKTLEKWCKETYSENFSQVFAKKRAKGKISLRRAQFQLAQKNAAMAIFLGKNYLNQRDNPVDDSEIEDIDVTRSEVYSDANTEV
jgi:hypothetical protein